MNNLAVLSTVALPSLPLDFYLGATSDYSSGAHVDLVWHNPVMGRHHGFQLPDVVLAVHAPAHHLRLQVLRRPR